jgi:hypothetical protein
MTKTQHTKAMAVNTLIRPKVEYNSAVWDPYTKENIDKIERVQIRAARYVYNNYDYSSSVTTKIKQRHFSQKLQKLST